MKIGHEWLKWGYLVLWLLRRKPGYNYDALHGLDHWTHVMLTSVSLHDADAIGLRATIHRILMQFEGCVHPDIVEWGALGCYR